jgi:succinyl-diaminopimelate desuccinylase
VTDALTDRAARYVAIPSISGNERALADEIEQTLRAAPHLEVTRIADNVVARTSGSRARRVVVAGHLDTVPGDAGAVSVRDGTVVGLGACDMKGSLAVMVELAIAPDTAASEVTWVFYANEEVPRDRSGLLEVANVAPELLRGDVALLCEPTSCGVQAGCQGSLRVRLELRGERAHTARPWRGRNAIHRLAGPIATAASYSPREVVLDGVTYTEQLQAVEVTGGISGNVVPDVATLTLNQRIAPDRTVAAALKVLRDTFSSFLEDGDGFEVIDAAEPAAPNLSHPFMARLCELSGVAPSAKLGYTDVSMFAAMGIPATNFGAGDPELAHHAGEFVPTAELARCFEVLGSLLAEPISL